MNAQKAKEKLKNSLLSIVLAFLILYLFTIPQYKGDGLVYSPKENIKALRQQSVNYQASTKEAGEYFKKIEMLNKDYDTISTSDRVIDLQNMIPKSADPVEVINELSSIVSQNGMRLETPAFSIDTNNIQNPYNTISVTFSVKASYPVFKGLLRDLENSKRIYNIKSVSFSSSQDSKASSNLSFSVSVDTYYLKN